MANKIITTNYPDNIKQIMIADSQMISLGIKVANTGVSADSEGKKVVKAGTPVYGDIKARNTAFTVSGEGNPAGVVLHDVDVTAGTENAALVIFGVVDLEKVESDVETALESAESALAGRIFLTTASGNVIQK